MKNCKYCGKEFLDKMKNNCQKYCCYRCRKKAHKLRQRKRRGVLTGVHRVKCDVCGKFFWRGSNPLSTCITKEQKMYCSRDCSNNRNRCVDCQQPIGSQSRRCMNCAIEHSRKTLGRGKYLTCFNCGKRFYRARSVLRERNPQRVFCSAKCYRGFAKYEGAKWRKQKNKIRQLAHKQLRIAKTTKVWCAICNQPIDLAKERFDRDHIVPLNHEINGKSKLAITHRICNFRKKDSKNFKVVGYIYARN